MVFFITGASSFIGLELCRYLTNNGHQVIAMTRRDNIRLNEIALGGNLQLFHADMHTLIERARGIKSDVFVHLAWMGTTHEERNDPAIHSENVRLSLEYVRLAKRMGCKLYVDAGSQAEYGIVPGIITEETVCKPFSAYGKAKLELYKKTRVLADELGMKYIHLRILSVFGENDHSETLIMTSLRKMKAGEPIVMRSGDQKWNYVYVKDAARQISILSLSAIEEIGFTSEIYNIASTDTRYLKDFVYVLRDITKSTCMITIGGYNPDQDVNLDPDTTKTSLKVQPLTQWKFEDVVSLMLR